MNSLDEGEINMLNNKTGGYTLIEALVVVAIIAVVSAAAVIYGKSSQEFLTVFRERARLIAVIYRAKSLTISTYDQQPTPCGYGVHIDRGTATYVLFKDIAANCSSSDNSYSGGSEFIESYTLPAGYNFVSIPNNFDVLYKPPDPTTVLTPPAPSQNIGIKRTPNGTEADFKVNDGGQITTL